MPPLQGARHDPLRGRDSLTRAAQTRRGRRICAGACPSAPSKPIFRSKSFAQGPKWPPLAEFCPKNGLRRRSKAAGNSSRAFSLRESLGTTCFRRPACQARTHDRACHRPDRANAFGTGVGPCGPPRYGLPISVHILTAPNQNPRSARRAPVSPECDFFLPRGREPGPRPTPHPLRGAAEDAVRRWRTPGSSSPRSGRPTAHMGRGVLRSTAPDPQPGTG